MAGEATDVSGKQIFWGILILLIIIKAPNVVNELVNGLVTLFTTSPGH